jgi:hypothetical protein
MIAGACAIALVIGVARSESRKSPSSALALIVAGAIAIGGSAHFLATFRNTHFAAAALSWHDFKVSAENHPADCESAAIRGFVAEHSGYIASFAALDEEVKARAADYPAGSAARQAIAQGANRVDAQQAETAGARWTLFLGVCVLLFGIAEMVRVISAAGGAADGTASPVTAVPSANPDHSSNAPGFIMTLQPGHPRYESLRRPIAIGASMIGALVSFVGSIWFWQHAKRMQSEFGGAADEIASVVHQVGVVALVVGLVFTVAAILIACYFHPGKRRPNRTGGDSRTSN